MIVNYIQKSRIWWMLIASFLAFESGAMAVESYDCPLVGIGTNYANPFSPNGQTSFAPARDGTLLHLNLTGGSDTETFGIWNLASSGGASISLLGIGVLDSAPVTKLTNGNLEFDLSQKPDTLLGYLLTGLSLQYNWSATATFNNPEIISLRPNASYQVTFDVDGSNGLLKSVLGLVPSFTFQFLDGAGAPIRTESSETFINIIGLLGTGVPTGSITAKFTTGSTVAPGPVKIVFKGSATLGATALGLGKTFATVSNLKLRSNTCLSVGDLVWRDANANALKDSSEVGINGLAVQLYSSVDAIAGNADDALIESTSTDLSGKYLFQKLPPGKYFVKVTPPAAYPLSSYPVVTLDDQVNNDNNGTQPGGQGTPVYSPVIQLTLNGESVTDGDADSYTDLTVDFGLRECDVIVITPPVLAPGNVGSSYSESMFATGGSGVYSWSMAGGSLPSGLSFGTTGLVSGIPAEQGTFLFIAKAVDTYGSSGMQAVSVTIRPLPIIHALAMDDSGRYLAGGEFYQVGGAPHVNLVRLNRDGSVDETFIPSAPNGPVYCIQFRAGSIYVGGSFTEWGGDAHRYLVKLNDDGSRDSAFDVSNFSAGAGDSVRAISKNGFYVAGHFTSPGQDVAAIDPSTGNAITTFQPSGPNIGATVHDVIYDGSRIVVAGNFSTFNAISHRGIAALSTSGALDSNWVPSATANNDARTLVQSTDTSSLLAGGTFTTYGTTTALTGAARLVSANGQASPLYAGTGGLAVNTIYKMSLP